MRIGTGPLILATLLGAATTAARGDVALFMTDPVAASVGPQRTNFPTSGPSRPSLVLPRFSPENFPDVPSNAVLEGVRLTLDASLTSQATMTFRTVNTTIRVTVSDGRISIQDPEGQTLVQVGGGADSLSFDFHYTVGPNDPIPSGPIVLPSQTESGSSTVELTRAGGADLTPYQGSGTVDLPVAASAMTSFSSSTGNGFGQALTLAQATGSIVYIYSVPETASLALVALGGAALLLKRALQRRPPSGRPESP